MSFQLSPGDRAILYASAVITTYTGLTLFSLGLIGNSLNFITFAFWKPYRPLTTSKFLATAAFSSQTYLSMSIFISSLSNLIGFNPSSRNLNLCRASLLISRTALQISLTCVCLSSIDRYLVTSRSAYLRGWLTVTRSYLAIMISIFIWFCYTIPNAVFASSNPIANICIPSSVFSGILTYLNLTFAVILPISIMIIFGILTYKNLKNIRLSTMNAQVTRMILLDVIVVAVSNIPVACFFIYAVTQGTNRQFKPIETLLVFIAQCISSLQSSISFYIYLTVSRTFRKNVKGILLMMLCCGKKQHDATVFPASATIEMRRHGMTELND